MSNAAAEDMLRKACARVSRLKEPDWTRPQLRGDAWDNVGRAIVKVLDELKGHGVTKPLAKLQELAFTESLAKPGDRSLQTVALWLTDSRIWLEKWMFTKASPHGEDKGLRGLMERRGLLNPKKGTA